MRFAKIAWRAKLIQFFCYFHFAAVVREHSAGFFLRNNKISIYGQIRNREAA